MQAITQQLRDDDMMERAQVEIRVAPADVELVPDLKALHDRILARRTGKPIDIDQTLEAGPEWPTVYLHSGCVAPTTCH